MSRDHHHGLLVGWKIRTGIRKDISPDRIYKYLTWFYQNHLISHFQEEETLLFPIVGAEHDQVKKAMEEHAEIHEFFKQVSVSISDLVAFEKVLTAHIRFEERELFNTIQEQASEDDLEALAFHLEGEDFVENTKDQFWITSDKDTQL